MTYPILSLKDLPSQFHLPPDNGQRWIAPFICDGKVHYSSDCPESVLQDFLARHNIPYQKP